MAVLRKKRTWVVAAVVATVCFCGWYLWGPQNPALMSLNAGNASTFAHDFDNGAKEARLVLLLSPT